MRIIQLPSVIANQIAAGEVIERPASVVKELLENAFDAGADAISIEVSYGGLNQIKISDNGEGILAEDLPLAVAAHATSKIKTLDDLYAINSMGFRGEALASIASVSNLCIYSKPLLQEHAMSLSVLGKDLQLAPCARTKGTTIEVMSLFYNAPVRKRFLKSEKIEFQALETVVKRFALSAPHIAITLKHNGKLIFSLPSSENNALKRVTKILGQAFIKNAIFLEVEHAKMRLYGWISSPAYQRSHNDKVWVYINRRMVKDKLIHHALRQVYEGLLHPGRFPACLLYLNLPTAEVDVNVHPTKHEVRFVAPKLIHDFISSQLKRALNTKSQINEEYAYKSPVLQAAQPQRDLSASQNVLPSLFDSWVYLNARYLLIHDENHSYLIDFHQFTALHLKQSLTKMPLPLIARNVSVPLRYPATPSLKQTIVQLRSDLIQFGLQIECDKKEQLRIRSIPIAIPYLDIRLFLHTLAKTPDCNKDLLLDIICQSQRVDVRLLHLEEKEALLQSLKASKGMQTTWNRVLTEETCRVLFYD